MILSEVVLKIHCIVFSTLINTLQKQSQKGSNRFIIAAKLPSLENMANLFEKLFLFPPNLSNFNKSNKKYISQQGKISNGRYINNNGIGSSLTDELTVKVCKTYTSSYIRR